MLGVVAKPAPPADTAQRILDIAERLVQTRGFNGFSYADIAEALRGVCGGWRLGHHPQHSIGLPTS
jgi:AcrR family transcriptional regulator